MSKFWKRHSHHKDAPRSSGSGVAKVPTAEVFNVNKNEIDYAEQFKKWPQINELDDCIFEFEWEGFGAMFLGLTIVNMYDNRGIIVKKVDPDGAGGQFGVEPGDYFIGIGGRVIPKNLPDGEVAKVFHSLPMPLSLSFARIPDNSANSLFDWTNKNGQVTSSASSPRSQSRKIKPLVGVETHFLVGDAVSFFKGSTAYYGNIQDIHESIDGKTVCDVLLPKSSSLIQDVPIGRLSHRTQSPAALKPNIVRTNSMNSPNNKPKSSAGDGGGGGGGTKPGFLRQPSGTALAPSPRAAAAVLNIKTKSASPKFINSFNPFDDFPTELPSKSDAFSVFSPRMDEPFQSSNNGQINQQNQNFDLFETCTEDAETVETKSNASYDFNEEQQAPQKQQQQQSSSTTALQSTKLNRSLSRSLSNLNINNSGSGDYGTNPRSPMTLRSPSGISNSFDGLVSPGKALFLKGFNDEKNATNETLDSKSLPSSSPKGNPSPKFYVKKPTGALQPQRANSRNLDMNSTFNPFD
mmetsp:Transcript_41171/g.53106  ORF Transcript_41171/g.53106 Transcript_41171/m.53106 type:complete len:520 (+) Transcript_41171:52-1611(+)